MLDKQKIDIIGACCDLGVHVNGTNLAPEILEKEIDSKLYNEIYNVFTQEGIVKELDKDNKHKNLAPLNEFNERLYKKVKEVVDSGNFPFTIGGDHAIAMASDLAVISKYKNLGIIWFDAHGDYHTFKTTMSGNIHGLPFAAVTGYEKTLITDFHGDGPRFNPKNAVVLGGRDIDLPDELNNLKDAGVTIFTTQDIKEQGCETIYKKAFEIASKGTNGVHVSYDLDVIDPKIAPGVSIPAIDGINLDEAYSFAKFMVQNKKLLSSIDFVEYNPLRDKDNVTLDICKNILKILFEGLNK